VRTGRICVKISGATEPNASQLNRREFLSSGIRAVAGPIFPVFRTLPVPAASSPVFEIKPMRGVDFILQNSPTRKKFLI
jgi:hypothetical protein